MKGFKNLKKDFAEKNISKLFKLLESNFFENYNKKYVKLILKISESFNIRLKRSQKQKFCRKCLTFFTSKNRKIRVNKKLKAIEYICLECSNIKRYRYK